MKNRNFFMELSILFGKFPRLVLASVWYKASEFEYILNKNLFFDLWLQRKKSSKKQILLLKKW